MHGIPGHDVGESFDPALPVDVQVNGSICLLKGFAFRDIASPFTVPAGSYSLSISLASTVAPGSNPALLTAHHVAFADGEDASVVAYLNAQGEPGLTVFKNDFTLTPSGDARLLVHHAAFAPAVDITVSRDKLLFGGWPYPYPLATLHGVANGEQSANLVPAGPMWNFPLTQVTLTPAGQTTPVIGPYFFQLVPHTAYLVYAVGSLETGSFTLIHKCPASDEC